MASYTFPAADVASETEPLFNSTSNVIQLLVRNINSGTTVIQAHPDDTLDSMLNAIGESMAYTAGNLCAVYAGQELSLEATISELQLPRDAVIHLTSRLRSTQCPDAWNLASKIIDAGRSAATRNLTASINALDELVRSFLEIAVTAEKKKKHSFIDSTKPEPNPTMEYLSIFLQSGAAKILVQLYLSTYAPHQVAAERTIRNFVSRGSRYGVLVCTAPVILEFCRLIHISTGSNDRLYTDLRAMLVIILSLPGYIQQPLPDMPRDWTAEQVTLFAQEARNVAMNGAFSGTASAKALFDFSIFSQMLQFEVRVLGASGKSSSSPTCPWRVKLSSMLESMLECVHECLDRLELELVQFQQATSSREPPKWHEPQLHAIWIVLAELELWSQVLAVEVLLELRRKLRDALAAHKEVVTTLVVSVKRDWIFNICWISRHRDIMAFEARRHLALTILLELETGIDDAELLLHVVVVDRSRVLVDSLWSIEHASPLELHAGLSVEFKHEVATGPGVMKEWFCLVCHELFNPNVLFSACPQDRRRFFLNSTSDLDPLQMRYIFFSGRMIALALMHKIHVGVFLDRTLFLQLAGRDITLDDIIDADHLYMQVARKS